MPSNEYYSVRTGVESGTLELTFDELKQLVFSGYRKFEDQGYFAEAYGRDCVDSGPTIGKMGANVELFFLQRLRKRDLWPIHDNIANYSEHDLFSVLELLHEYVSKPQYSYYHEWNNCGNHYDNFDAELGQEEFLTEVNTALRDYQEGRYQLSPGGEVLEVPDSGLEELIKEPLPAYQPEAVEEKVKVAIQKFHRFDASDDDRKEAVRTLVDVLEYLRPNLSKVISSKDESDLFNIANNFSIRHHNQDQKGDYDQGLYVRWLFYTYLATIHLVLGVLARGDLNVTE